MERVKQIAQEVLPLVIEVATILLIVICRKRETIT